MNAISIKLMAEQAYLIHYKHHSEKQPYEQIYRVKL